MASPEAIPLPIAINRFAQFAEKVELDAKFRITPPVDTPEFKAWFGDSKVADPDGNLKKIILSF